MTDDPSPDVPPNWPAPGPVLPFRHGIRGIAGAGYRWAVLGLPTGDHDPLAGDELYLEDHFVVHLVGRLASDPDDPMRMPDPGWRVERRTRRRVLLVNDPGGWRAHEG
jgi:hypothetical protein